MVNKLLNLIKQISTEKGEIALFLLMKIDSEANKWTIVISSPWIDRANRINILNYWLEKIRNSLVREELNSIARITFLSTEDHFVTSFNRTIKVTESAVNLKNTEIAGINIYEAIILVSQKILSSPARNLEGRNPVYNHTINPVYNHTINPVYNHTINPVYNHTINPVYNHAINPVYNHAINPVYNHAINPVYNHTINPVYNHTINPVFNHVINPTFNPNFNGFSLFERNNQKIGYIIDANDEIKLIYNLDNQQQGYAIKNNQSNYIVFDKTNSWIGYFISDSSDGFNYFSRNNEWIGIVK